MRCFSVGTVQKLHDDKRLSKYFVNFVDGANVGVVQRRCSFGLALKSREGLWVSGDIIRKEFQRNETIELEIFGLVNHTHPATTEFFKDAVVRDGPADERVGSCHVPLILGLSTGQVNEARFLMITQIGDSRTTRPPPETNPWN